MGDREVNERQIWLTQPLSTGRARSETLIMSTCAQWRAPEHTQTPLKSRNHTDHRRLRELLVLGVPEGDGGQAALGEADGLVRRMNCKEGKGFREGLQVDAKEGKKQGSRAQPEA